MFNRDVIAFLLPLLLFIEGAVVFFIYFNGGFKNPPLSINKFMFSIIVFRLSFNGRRNLRARPDKEYHPAIGVIDKVTDYSFKDRL